MSKDIRTQVECTIGGGYEMPDGRKFWVDGPVAREMTRRVMQVAALYQVREALDQLENISAIAPEQSYTALEGGQP